MDKGGSTFGTAMKYSSNRTHFTFLFFFLHKRKQDRMITFSRVTIAVKHARRIHSPVRQSIFSRISSYKYNAYYKMKLERRIKIRIIFLIDSNSLQVTCALKRFANSTFHLLSDVKLVKKLK
jgi:hypothetical protein